MCAGVHAICTAVTRECICPVSGVCYMACSAAWKRSAGGEEGTPPAEDEGVPTEEDMVDVQCVVEYVMCVRVDGEMMNVGWQGQRRWRST